MSELFGKYELIRRLAVGGMAEVYLARTFGTEGFRKSVVIKCILPAYTDDPDFVAMFVNEARLAAKLQHANIVQVFDFNEVDGTHYIAMEWVDGIDSHQLMVLAQQKGMPVPRSLGVHVASEALKGLHYAHTKSDGGQLLGLVHRDISPNNLLISYAGEVKIADFGIAKAVSLVSATRTGVVKGKLAYMSPEQIRGDKLDQRSDLFSLGIVVWELLAGEPAFRTGTSTADLVAKVRGAQVRRLREVNPNIPEELDQIVARILATRVSERYANAAEVLTDLNEYVTAADALEVSAYLNELAPQTGEPGEPIEGPIVRRGTPKSSANRKTTTDSLAAQPSSITLPPIVASLAKSRAARNWLQPLIAGCLMLILCALITGWVNRDEETVEEATPIAVKTLRISREQSDTDLRAEGLSLPSKEQLLIFGPADNTLLVENHVEDRTEVRMVTLGETAAVSFVPQESVADERPKPAPPARAVVPQPEPEPPIRRVEPQPVQHASVEPARVAPTPVAPTPAASAPQPPRPAVAVRPTQQLTFGKLQIVVYPWANVYIDGRMIGTTPITGYRLTAGRHRVKLENVATGKLEQLSVLVVQNQLLEIRRDWRN